MTRATGTTFVGPVQIKKGAARFKTYVVRLVSSKGASFDLTYVSYIVANDARKTLAKSKDAHRVENMALLNAIEKALHEAAPEEPNGNVPVA